MVERASVHYAVEPGLSVAAFRQVLIASGLGAQRPVSDDARLSAMLLSADLILTARLESQAGPLIGVARCITDFSWCCYISELAVAGSAQGLHIGTGLLGEARRRLGTGVSIVLVSVPAAAGFYERAGMARVADAFWYHRQD